MKHPWRWYEWAAFAMLVTGPLVMAAESELSRFARIALCISYSTMATFLIGIARNR